MDHEDPEIRSHPPSPATMSKVPSWVSLGFVLGALVVWAVPKPEPKAPPPAPARAVAPPREPQATKLTTVEAVFAEWGSNAVWDSDTTQMAYWNPGTEGFTEFYEVRRIADALYFRSIPKLTRLVIRHGKPLPPECPLQFTETPEQYREWREQAVERSGKP